MIYICCSRHRSCEHTLDSTFILSQPQLQDKTFFRLLPSARNKFTLFIHAIDIRLARLEGSIVPVPLRTSHRSETTSVIRRYSASNCSPSTVSAVHFRIFEIFGDSKQYTIAVSNAVNTRGPLLSRPSCVVRKSGKMVNYYRKI